MATLSQVYTNLGVGAFISTVSYLGFGAAVRTESNSNLTPRAWARPVEVIQNCLSRPYCLGWIPWAMSLRYVDLLAGIPGTGTRKRGWSGPLLKTNLDGIVLLRYHALQFKVSAVSTILCMMILLPLYYTSRCDPLVIGPDFCDQHARLTDFEQLTIANVLPQAKSEIVYTNGTKVEYTNPYYIVYFNQSLDDIDIINSLKIRWSPGITERYLATTFVIAIITIYTCYLLWHEWIQCLALRRVYYLESEYYEERLDELNDIRRNTDPEDPFQKIRPPFLPHPELRETVPNVSLHSVLYKLPSNLRSNFDFDSSGTSGKTPTLLERQLDAAVEFFDQCVPNQSGYTSSIAAISMVPDAKQLTKVWGKWYACGNHLRRLRHLKALLERRREMKQAGQLSLHDILVLAPANIARATLKATTETLDTVKDRAVEGIGTVKEFTTEKIAEGIDVVRGLGHHHHHHHNRHEHGHEHEINEHEHEHEINEQHNNQSRDEGKLSAAPAAPAVAAPPQTQLVMDDSEGTCELLSCIPCGRSGAKDHWTIEDDRDRETSKTHRGIRAKTKANSIENDTLPDGIALMDSANAKGSRYNSLPGSESVRGLTSGTGGSATDAVTVDVETGTSPVQPSCQSSSPRDTGKTTTPPDNAESNCYTDREMIVTESALKVVIRGTTDNEKSQDGDNHDRSSSALVTESAVPGFKTGSTTDQFEYDEFDPVTFAKWLGYSEETELDQLVDTLDVEQLSVFARETAQSASNPCVYGCSPNTLHFFSIEQLEVLVEDTWKAARDANAMLLLARAEMFDEDKTKGVEISKKEQKISKNNDCADAHNDVEITPTVNMARPKSDSSVRFDLKDETNNMPDPSSTNDKKDSSNPLSDPPSNIQGSVFFKSGLRKRGKNKTRAKSTRAKYQLAQKLVKELTAISAPINETGEDVSGCCHGAFLNVLGRRAKKGAVSLTRVLDHPSYCVVTFTSRQAAIAARQCLADGKGTQAWTQIQNIPMHPLADAPPRNPFFCRGCCRPVTLTIPAKEKRTRSIITWALYVLFCLVYTIPLTFASQVLNPTLLAELYPNAEIFQDPDTFFVKALAGISTGYIYTLFFSVLPQIFKLLAFSEGSSSSKAKAEENAMRFYWYFMLVTAFTGQSLVQMFIDGILQGNVTEEFKDILGTVAASIATTQAPTWLNWIIVRTGTTLPLNYLLQIMTFVYGWLKIPWLNRVMRGGGPGGPPPYRIYIDSGVVFMCLTSLAPACPIIAPCCLLYYAVFIPMLRWLHVFVYRPFYDGGGNRLPVIHEIIISSLILSQFLLGTVLLLKQCFILGITTSMMSFPTFIFSQWTKEKFERSYNDAGLWQTSKLDGLSNKESMQEREKYRRWLVDVHKASYVPMCLSGGEDFLTNQPAVVVPIERELAGKDEKRSPRHELQREATQKGAIFRRYLDS